jgi:predicted lipoprotein
LRSSLGGALLFGLGGGACRRPPTREEVLHAIVKNVVASNTREVLRASERLLESTSKLAASPALETLLATRRAWRPALLAWKGAQCFRQGPMVETSALLRAAFWPARPPAIDGVLASERAVDDALVAELGVDAKGLYALEYLLFPLDLDDSHAAARFAGGSGLRRAELAHALARSIHRYAELASRRLGTGDDYAGRFAKAGNESLSTLLAELIATVENVCVQRLDYVLKLAESRLLKPREVEGWPSALSHEIALTQVVGSERLYAGGGSGGLSLLTRVVAPAVDERVRAGYREALAAVRALGSPLERVVHSNRPLLERAAQATKQLEITMKVELTSALGVTLTFASADGD